MGASYSFLGVFLTTACFFDEAAVSLEDDVRDPVNEFFELEDRIMGTEELSFSSFASFNCLFGFPSSHEFICLAKRREQSDS